MGVVVSVGEGDGTGDWVGLGVAVDVGVRVIDGDCVGVVVGVGVTVGEGVGVSVGRVMGLMITVLPDRVESIISRSASITLVIVGNAVKYINELVDSASNSNLILASMKVLELSEASDRAKKLITPSLLSLGSEENTDWLKSGSLSSPEIKLITLLSY